MKNSARFSYVLVALLVTGITFVSAHRVEAAFACVQECLTKCEDDSAALRDLCESALDSHDPDYLTLQAGCEATYQQEYNACPADCDAQGLPGTCPSPAATPTTTPKPTTTVQPGAGWMTLVPYDCQDENGCDVCEITKVFTNFANIIAAALSALALLMFIVGGLFMILSAGNEQRVTRGKQILIGTISGVAIVFLAWFAVNVIVRMAAASGGSSASGSLTTSAIFSTDWWNFSNCYPPLPTSCKGLKLGASCGTGSEMCPSGKTNQGVCSCFRRLDPNGDSATCGVVNDATSTSTVNDPNNNPDKACMCIDPCARLALTTGADYQCYPDSKIDATYSVAEGVSCGKSGTTCALLNP